MKRKYYITYWYKLSDNNWGVGNCTLLSKQSKINSELITEAINDIQKECFNKKTRIVITNIIKLKGKK